MGLKGKEAVGKIIGATKQGVTACNKVDKIEMKVVAMEHHLLKVESKWGFGAYKGECARNNIPIFREVAEGRCTNLQGEYTRFIEQKMGKILRYYSSKGAKSMQRSKHLLNQKAPLSTGAQQFTGWMIYNLGFKRESQMKQELWESQEVKSSKPRKGWCRGRNPALLHFYPKESHFGWADCKHQVGVQYAWELGSL
jgi:hypothetical protein